MSSEPGYHIIQDWTDYDKSLISTSGELYYKEKGIQAYSLKSGSPIPNELTNSYPHAHSFIKTVKNYLQQHPDDKKIKILDLGSGSGLFARHVLIAAKEEGILDRVEILLGDMSAKALKEIKKTKVLDDFTEGKDYQFIELNIYEPEKAKELGGKPYKLDKVSVVVLNYFYDALPMIVLKPAPQNQEHKFKKLQFRFLVADDGTKAPEINAAALKADVGLLSRLLIDERWVAYNIDEQDEVQKKYYDLLDPKDLDDKDRILYNYGSLEATSAIIKILDEDGFIFAADMPNNPLLDSSFQIYGNAAAHFLNERLITKVAKDAGSSSFIEKDSLLLRMLYFKKQENFESLGKFLKAEFTENSYTDLYADIRQALCNIKSPHSKAIFRYLTNELIKIDRHSCLSKILQAQANELEGKEAEAKALYAEAKKINFLNDFDIN